MSSRRRLLVLGSYGQLGREVADEAERVGWEVARSRYHDISDAQAMWGISDSINPDAVINCAGVVPGSPRATPAAMIRANAVGPHVVAEVFGGGPVIHVSTDCVFSGARDGSAYDVFDKPDATSNYGQTKALGEPNNAIVVRTSFIGYRVGLLPWLLAQEPGSTITGWLYANWIGSTVYEVARHLVVLAGGDPTPRIEHLSAPLTNKYDLLRELNCVFDLKLNIEHSTSPRINRWLNPTIQMERRLGEFLCKYRYSGRA